MSVFIKTLLCRERSPYWYWHCGGVGQGCQVNGEGCQPLLFTGGKLGFRVGKRYNYTYTVLAVRPGGGIHRAAVPLLFVGHHLGKFGGGGQSVVSDREAGLKPLLLAQRLLTHPLTTLLKAGTKTTFFLFRITYNSGDDLD